MAITTKKLFQLPEPKGIWLKAFGLVWSMMLIGSLIVTAMGVIDSAWDGPFRMPLLKVGINYTRDASPGLIIYDVALGQAKTAGLIRGDRIIAIDGGSPDDGLNKIIDEEDGSAFRLTVQTQSGTKRDVVLRTAPKEVESSLNFAGFTGAFLRWWTMGVGLVSGSIMIIAAIQLFRKQRQNPCAAVLAVVPLFIVCSNPQFVSFGVSQWMAWLALCAMRIALLAFPDGKYVSRLSLWLIAANIVWLPMGYINDRFYENGATVLLAASVGAMYWRYRTRSSPVERQQMRWAMLGFAGSAIAAVLLVIVSLISYQFNDLRTVISLDMFMDVLDTLYSGLLWGGLLLALLRYRLYDADVVITRSAVWVAATPAIAFIFAALVEVLKQFAGPLFGNDFILTPIAGVVTAMSIQPIAKWTERTIEAWSRRDLLALKKDLPAAVRDLREIDDRDRLLAYVCGTVRPAMRAQGVAIVVYEGEGLILGHKVGNTDDEINVWLSQSDLAPNRVDIDIDRGDTLFPIRIPLTARPMGDNQTIAWLLLGPRPDGSIQDKDARDTLVEAAPEIGHALHVISARRERNQAIVAGLTDQIIAIAT